MSLKISVICAHKKMKRKPNTLGKLEMKKTKDL